jgi:hypothetical protein
MDYKSMNAGNQYGAMVPIATVTVTGPQAIAFTNIPQTYQDLLIVVNTALGGTGSGATSGYPYYYNTSLNGDGTTSNYSTTFLLGNGSTASSTRVTSSSGAIVGGYIVGSTDSSMLGIIYQHILNYTNTSGFKTVLARSSGDMNGAGFTSLSTMLWRNTSAITQINTSHDWVPGSTLTLYGIRGIA